MLKQYIDYLRDNPKGYWFKARLYGWGWVPITWQGWAVVLIYIALLLIFSTTISESSPPQEVVFTFLLPMVTLTSILIRICYKKGEKPYWSWGKPKKNK